MKSFFSFLSEARTSQAAEMAARQNLTGDGHGNWYDKDGNRVAVTKKGRLEMLSKKEKQSEPETEVKNDTPKQEQPAPQKCSKDSNLCSRENLEHLQMELQGECLCLQEQMVLLKKTLEISQ